MKPKPSELEPQVVVSPALYRRVEKACLDYDTLKASHEEMVAALEVLLIQFENKAEFPGQRKAYEQARAALERARKLTP